MSNLTTLLESDTLSLLNSPDNEGRTPLMISGDFIWFASIYNHWWFLFPLVYLSSFEIFKALLNSGADEKVYDNVGFTALHLAILRRKRECVIQLMKHSILNKIKTPYTRVTIQELFLGLMSNVLPTRNVSNNLD